MSQAPSEGHAHFQPQTQPTSRQRPPPSHHTTSLATDLVPGHKNVPRTSARPRGAENEYILLTPQPQRRYLQSGHQVARRAATEAPPPEWQPGGQTSSPIPTLHDHGPNSLTLATVRVSSYPKPYGPPQPYYRARVTTFNPSDGSGRDSASGHTHTGIDHTHTPSATD